MKYLKRLMLVGALAFASPFVLPAVQAEAQRPMDYRIERLGAEFSNRPGTAGMTYIAELDSDSPLLGICEVGDFIVNVNGIATPNTVELIEAMAQVPHDTYVSFTIRDKDSPLVYTASVFLE